MAEIVHLESFAGDGSTAGGQNVLHAQGDESKLKSQICELHNIHGRYSDFAEAEILNRNSEIINGFIGYLAEQGLIA